MCSSAYRLHMCLFNHILIYRFICVDVFLCLSVAPVFVQPHLCLSVYLRCRIHLFICCACVCSATTSLICVDVFICLSVVHTFVQPHLRLSVYLCRCVHLFICCACLCSTASTPTDTSNRYRLGCVVYVSLLLICLSVCQHCRQRTHLHLSVRLC